MGRKRDKDRALAAWTLIRNAAPELASIQPQTKYEQEAFEDAERAIEELSAAVFRLKKLTERRP